MKVLSVFLLLSSALAQSNSAPADAQSNSAPTDAQDMQMMDATVDGVGPDKSVSDVPLFDFDLAPYNVALDIVADGLEKLADTMEPLALPLPLVGPGYYLEIQVKSPKGGHGPPPPTAEEVNAISIEGGQAPPVTEIDIILPGNSVVHQTILLTADVPDGGHEGPMDSELVQSSNAAAPTEVPDYESQSATGEESADYPGSSEVDLPTNSSSEELEEDASILVPPIPAGTESGDGELVAEPSQSTVDSSISGSQLAQSISPESPVPMETVSGFESYQSQSSGSSTGLEDGYSLPPSSSEQESGSEAASESDHASDIAQATSDVDGSSATLDDQSLSLGSLDSPAISDDSPDPWFGMFSTAASSAPEALDTSATAAEPEQSQLESDGVESESEVAESESQLPDSLYDEDEVSMASGLLPFPPFGGPQSQQLEPQWLEDPSDSASSGQAEAATTDLPALGGGGAGGTVETIDILGASDAGMLESSIDAVLHSVILDYKTESVPKAAVGFALIHPRSALEQDE
ncbi:hypothetical protein GGF46_004081 [Coemansia sp. RSA 552]|nr:hypothetical protein GGF46_004081 [Coemansia sp. RSA 552]